ncbi:MAG: FIST C-terminal domain-containing protein [Myxococcota bacterium]|nr:FIST C-terminal domain-containing protein [Myxococcota bacterium]
MAGVRVATVLVDGTTAEVRTKLVEAVRAQLGGATPTFVAVFASTSHPLDALVSAFAEPGTIAIGASTAGEFIEHGDAKSSVSVFALAGGDAYRASAGIGVGLRDDPAGAIARALEGQPRTMEGFPYRTAITLLDPLAGNGEEVALMLADALGPDQPIAGGAAGDDLKMQQTFVACGTQSSSDAITVAQIFSKRPLGLGIEHGHRALSEPLRVTRASGGYVHEIESRPAWDVWKEKTAAAARERGIDVSTLEPSAEGAFLLQFEAGLANGATYKIRAPLSRTPEGSILFAAGIPEGSVLRITESDGGSQIVSAIGAARRARGALGDAPIAGALVFDCICRNLILGEEFGTAVRGISEALGGVRIAGFETYGEVALSAGEMSGFHNTTSVVLAFPE